MSAKIHPELLIRHLIIFRSTVMAICLIATTATAQNTPQPPTESYTPTGWAEIYNPLSKSTDSLFYEIIDGLAIHQGDIVLGPASAFQTRPSSPGGQVQNGVGHKSLGKRWEDGIVYYDINGHTGSSQILNAMSYIEANTSIRFIARTSQPGYVNFVPSNGCWSYIGDLGYPQDIGLANGCLYKGIITHELFHALGIFHEQSRLDRDTYVTIHTANIQQGKAGNFAKANSGFAIGPYDYGSLMHYGKYSFSVNGQPTITTNPPGISIGQRNGLSQGDIETIQYMYHTDLELDLNTVLQVNPGGPVQAAITVSNLGDATIGNVIAKDVKVITPLPPQTVYVGFSSTDSWTCQQVGQDVECSLDILDRNATTTLTLDFTAPTSLSSMELKPNVIASNRDIEMVNNESFATIVVSSSFPVELISFSSEIRNNFIDLFWTTASELNNEKFVVQRSVNGRDYHAIGEIGGSGTTPEPQNYSYTDQNPFYGINYYRLKQIDFDGQLEYSNVISSRYDNFGTRISELFPNPTQSGLVSLEYHSNHDSRLSVSVFDITGKLLTNQFHQVSRGENSLKFDFSTIGQGLHIVKLEDGFNQAFRKLVVE